MNWPRGEDLGGNKMRKDVKRPTVFKEKRKIWRGLEMTDKVSCKHIEKNLDLQLRNLDFILKTINITRDS